MNYRPPDVRYQVNSIPWPRARLASGDDGAVTVLLYINEDGSVANVRALCATDDAFIPGVLQALRQNRYKPAMLDGKPIRDLGFQSVVFAW